MPPRRTAVAVFAFGLLAGAPACVPTPDRPGSNYDAGPIDPFDAPAEDRPPVDVPPVDRPPTTDRGFDAGAADAGDVPFVPGDGPDPTRSYPRGPFGNHVGDPFPAFNLADCMNGNYPFAGPDWRSAWATVVEFTAGYCAGCVDLAAALQTRVATPYGPRGVRVVDVLIGSATLDPPTTAYCPQWIEQTHVSHPIALDQVNSLGTQTFGMPLPQWVLVDANGIILWRAAGSTASLAELLRRLDAIVGAP